jgi:membrane protein involved in colicin uptake
MRTRFSKSNLLLAIFLVLAVSLNAQKVTSQYSTNQKNGKERIVTDRDDKTYQLEFTDGKMTFLSVDGVSVPEDKWSDYKIIIDEIREQMKKDKEQARLDRIQAEKDREQAQLDRLQADKDREQGNRDRLQAQKDLAQVELDRQGAMRDKLQADKDRLQADKDREQTIKDRAHAENDREQAVRDRAQADNDREQAVRDRAQAEKDRAQAVKDRAQAEKDRAQAEADRKLLADMTADLVSDKLITNADDLRMLTLSPTEMTVNGVKQPEAVHKKYMDKYNRFAKSNFAYISDGNGKRVQIRKDN